MKLKDATPVKSCDTCAAQEGRHYCMFHGQQVKNMDAVRCADWREQKVLLESPLGTQQLACGNRVPVENPTTIRVE